MNNKKAQSAMEYLMTYGWAILVVLIALGALFYLGVFSPKTANTCSASTPITCTDVKASGATLTILMGGSGINTGSTLATTFSGGTCTLAPATINTAKIDTHTCTITAITSGTKFNGKVTVTYSLLGSPSTLTHTSDVTFSGTAE